MKIEKLTDNKIRIILNIDDLAKKNIDVHSIIKNSDDTQKFFRSILKQAKKEVGFDIDNSKVLIEAYLSSEGFFVLTFTKIENKHEFNNLNSNKPKVKRKTLNYSSSTVIYEFQSFDEFCSFCTYLNTSKIKKLNGFAKNISLYEYSSKYFLVISQINKDFKYTSLFYTLISEFAKLSGDSDSFASKIKEYGNVVFKNDAIKNGIKFFANA